VLNDGTARCWGSNEFGGVGDGTTTSRLSPTLVAGVTQARAISTGEDHACALLANGGVVCWGWNFFGQLGDGTSTNRLVATPVVGLAGVESLSAGLLHTCARLKDTSLRCWGANNAGQLGDGTADNRSSAGVVPGTSPTDSLGVGGTAYHTCAGLANGSVECWGRNTYGELGDGTTDDQVSPVTVVGL